jgi:phage-related protein
LTDISVSTYSPYMRQEGKPLVWLHGEIKTPPLSRAARIEAGILLRRLQSGDVLSLPSSRPMPSIGRRCHELRITDEDSTWRVFYRIDSDAIVIGEVLRKKTEQTPEKVMDICRRRFREYDAVVRDKE